MSPNDADKIENIFEENPKRIDLTDEASLILKTDIKDAEKIVVRTFSTYSIAYPNGTSEIDFRGVDTLSVISVGEVNNHAKSTLEESIFLQKNPQEQLFHVKKEQIHIKFKNQKRV